MADLHSQMASIPYNPGQSRVVEEHILSMATDCEPLFTRSIHFVASKGERGHEIILQNFKKRFLDWTTYLGVFSRMNGSIDQRLKHHPQYRDLILLTLDMLNMNLLQTTVDPTESTSDESSDEEVDVRKIVLDGIQESLDELDQLAIHIRRPCISSLDYLVKTFASRKPAEVSSFEIKAILAVRWLYPKASENLRRYLSNLMTHRYTKLLYWHSQDKKLRKNQRRDERPQDNSMQVRHKRPFPDQEAPSQASVMDRYLALSNPEPTRTSIGQSPTSWNLAPDPDPHLTTPAAEAKVPLPLRAEASTVLGSKAKFPSPPRFEDGEVLKSCPLCRKTFLEADFTNETWWRCHVNEDLLPFACISTGCVQPPAFASRSEWKAHTQRDHGIFWRPGPVTPTGNKAQFDHPNADETSDLGPSANICPLCCLPIDRFGHTETGIPLARDSADLETGTAVHMSTMNHMMNHIADHLQFLALLTLRLSTEIFMDDDIHAFSSFETLSSHQDSEQRGDLDNESGPIEGHMVPETDEDESPIKTPRDYKIPDRAQDEWVETCRKNNGGKASSLDPILLHLYKRQVMSPMKWALLIASPYADLQGPINDVDSMQVLLEQHGFAIVRCCGAEATSDNILSTWHELISKVKEDDAVVAFYSGYGGIVQPALTDTGASTREGQSRRHQFIVPMDYNNGDSREFHGILNIEISFLIRRTTDKTKNVTVIFDCCHSEHMIHDPWHNGTAVPKILPRVMYHDLSKNLQCLRDQGCEIENHAALEGNEHIVRVTAAADSEIAWEYLDEHGKSVGALTKALVPALRQAIKADASWKEVLQRVCEQVNCRFPQQHPQAQGLHTRLVFSKATKNSSALKVTNEDGHIFIDNGGPIEVREYNAYALMPHGHDKIVEELKLAEASVMRVTASRAYLHLPRTFRLPEGGALAFLKAENLFRWPVSFPDEIWLLRRQLAHLRFIKPIEKDSQAAVFAHVSKCENAICVYNASGLKYGSFIFESEAQMKHMLHNAVTLVEHAARAHYIFMLKAPREEMLNHDLHLNVFSDSGSGPQTIPLDGTGKKTVGDRADIGLYNQGAETIFVTVLNITMVGEIIHMSPMYPQGIRLAPNGELLLRQSQPLDVPGLGMTWPERLPEDLEGPIPESIVCIVTDCPVDLHDFGFQWREKRRKEPGRDAPLLEKLTYQIAHGGLRDIAAENLTENPTPEVRWDIKIVSYQLWPRVTHH